MTRPVAVIGAGLTGLTAAHALFYHGCDVTVYERSYRVGGHARSEWMRGVPYEPEGAHLFHTSDEQVWALINSLVEMIPYRHRVLTELRGEMFSWPLQYDELDRLDEWPKIKQELYEVQGMPPLGSNFETWCITQMGETLYGLFIDGYTTKQWGRPGRYLAASIGPKRVELRRDGNRELFTDPFQGWPRDGYGALAEALAAPVRVQLGVEVTAADLYDVIAPGVPVIVTAPLDGFFRNIYGPLEWRGVNTGAHWLPDVVGYAQPAMVVNRPSLDVPYTRTIESKWVLDGVTRVRGTVVMYEYPGAPAKHYPVPDPAGTNEWTQKLYENDANMFDRNPLIVAGRLARYTYINMDQAMREGLDAASAAAHRVQ